MQITYLGKTLRPMRAAKLADSQTALIHFPCFGSPKFDGIRSIVFNNIALSNTLKPIRNRNIQSALSHLEYLDGELIAGSNFQETTSCVMSESGGSSFTYYVFDSFKNPNDIYINRIKDIEDTFIKSVDDERICMVQPMLLKTERALLDYEEWCLQQGFEGIMLRHPRGLYKFGRSTLNEEFLLKRKPVLDDEAIITGFEEQEENLNLSVLDNRGYAQRSMHQENKIGKGTLGAFLVHSAKWGDFKIGTGLGLTDSLRKEIWENQSLYIGQLITYKYQEFGSKDKPRQPIFIRFRHKDDWLCPL